MHSLNRKGTGSELTIRSLMQIPVRVEYKGNFGLYYLET